MLPVRGSEAAMPFFGWPWRRGERRFGGVRGVLCFFGWPWRRGEKLSVASSSSSTRAGECCTWRCAVLPPARLDWQGGGSESRGWRACGVRFSSWELFSDGFFMAGFVVPLDSKGVGQPLPSASLTPSQRSPVAPLQVDGSPVVVRWPCSVISSDSWRKKLEGHI
jgi:hypothetical protein